jgi:hypothetical protein
MEQPELLENHNTQEHPTNLLEINSLIQGEMSFAQAKQQENSDQNCHPALAY